MLEDDFQPAAAPSPGDVEYRCPACAGSPATRHISANKGHAVLDLSCLHCGHRWRVEISALKLSA